MPDPQPDSRKAALTYEEPTPYGPITFEPITCTACDEMVRADEWLAHARTHNPSAYREGWPCNCRPGKPCRKHKHAPWMKEPNAR